MKRRNKCVCWFVGILLVLVLVLLGAGQYFIFTALTPLPALTPEDEKELAKDAYPELASWVDTLTLRDTSIVDARGLRLNAYYAPCESSRRTAIIVHGYQGTGLHFLNLAYMYRECLHANIFLPDLSAHGMSEGDVIGMGWFDRLDILEWVKVAEDVFGDSTHIVLHGVSMGAATVMMVSGEDTPASVKAFVEDCGYTSVWDEFKGELKKGYGLPAFPIMHVTSLLNKIENGWSFREASALEAVKRSTKPMLFIHGDSDDFVPTAMVYPLYEAKKGKKELYLVPGAEHAKAYKKDAEVYTRKVEGFLQGLW